MGRQNKKLLIKGTLGNIKYYEAIKELNYLFRTADSMAKVGTDQKLIYKFLDSNGVILDFTD